MNSICTNRWHSTLSFCIFVSSLESGEYILDRKLTFHQTAQFYLKYSLFFSFLQMCECLIVLWFGRQVYWLLGESPKSLNSGPIPKNWHAALSTFMRSVTGETYTRGQSSSCSLWSPAGREKSTPSRTGSLVHRGLVVKVVLWEDM